MSDNPFKSNLPDGFQTGIKYDPLKTEAQKEEIRQFWKEYWAVPGNREAWYEAVLEGQNEEWLAKVTAKNRAQAQDPEWREGQRQNAINYWNSLSDDEKARWSQVQKDFWKNMSEEEYVKRCEMVQERWNDEEYRERLIAYTKVPGYGKMLSERNKKVAQRPEMQEWYKEFNKAKREDPEHVKRHAKGVKDRSNNNKEWKQKNCRAVWSAQYGVFEKFKELAEAWNKDNNKHPIYANRLVRGFLKNDDNQDYKYIDWDEYERLINDSSPLRR